MAPGWNEVKERAVIFSKEWKDALTKRLHPQPFATETKRIEFLFELYDKYIAGLFAVAKKPKVKKLN
jgi:hypothetical protein